MAYASVAAFILVAGGFMMGSLVLGGLLRPKHGYPAKRESYECGESPTRSAWFNYNPRFYIIALVYIVFDVEIAFIFPVASVFKRWVAQAEPGHRTDVIALVEIAVFVGILFVGLAYVWAKGDLDWDRGVAPQRERGPIAKQKAFTEGSLE